MSTPVVRDVQPPAQLRTTPLVPETPKFDRGALVKALAALIVADLIRAPGTIDS